ncbi:hypothetical protein MKX01_014475 [Papaver californicum]|nr:hypothetical protein MKX01_014475 [Papaver californicum]
MSHHHTISGLRGKLITISEFKVNCEAHKYYEIWKHHDHMPNTVPHRYTGVKVVEGHGKTSGCIKEWDYIHEGKTPVVKEKTTFDDETMTICHSAVGGDVLNADGKGCTVSWTIDYEKLNEESPVPINYLTFLQKNIS